MVPIGEVTFHCHFWKDIADLDGGLLDRKTSYPLTPRHELVTDVAVDSKVYRDLAGLDNNQAGLGPH